MEALLKISHEKTTAYPSVVRQKHAAASPQSGLPPAFQPLLRRFSHEKTLYAASVMQPFPEARFKAISSLLAGHYRSYSTAEIDHVLIPLIEGLRVGDSDLYCFASEEQISQTASDYAQDVENFIHLHPRPVTSSEQVGLLIKIIQQFQFTGVELPLPKKKIYSCEFSRDRVIAGLARMHCERWWRCQLRKVCFKKGEEFLRNTGRVGAGISPYISEITEKRILERQESSRNFLALSEIESDQGDSMSLGEVVDKSLSNPRNRLSELYVRCKGFDEIAEESALQSYMLTITAPSRFHSRHKRKRLSGEFSSFPNAKFDNSSPASAQLHLRKVWQRIRAKLARQEINVFGLRVVEPHHDGTPHWHLCVHVSPDDAPRFLEICKFYATQADREELYSDRRARARFDAVLIDPEKGSPRSYLFKYLSKNLTGSNGVSDESGLPVTDQVNSARNWASLWNIRQFQCFGSPSVTVWRQLRRLREKDLSSVSAEQFEQIRDAACTGNWRLFVELMGGVCAKRDSQPIKPLKQEFGENAYGEIVYRIKGLVMSQCVEEMDAGTFPSISVLTQEKVWRIIPPNEVKQKYTSLGFRPHEVRPLDNYQ